MQLDLTRYRQPRQRSSPGRSSRRRSADEGDAYRIVAPVDLAFEIHKDKDKFRLVGTSRTELELPCSRCLEPFRLPVAAPFDLRYLPASEASADAEREVDDEDLETSYYRERRDRSERAAARAVLPGAADEAAVPGGLPRAVPAVRHQPEYGHLRLRAGLGRSRGSRRSKGLGRIRES